MRRRGSSSHHRLYRHSPLFTSDGEESDPSTPERWFHSSEEDEWRDDIALIESVFRMGRSGWIFFIHGIRGGVCHDNTTSPIHSEWNDLLTSRRLCEQERTRTSLLKSTTAFSLSMKHGMDDRSEEKRVTV